MKRLFAVAVAAIAVLALSGVSSAATNPRVFNSVPDQLPGNVASVGFQATQTSEFGDAIRLAPGKRHIKTVKVVMSDWACQTGQWNLGTCVTTPGSTFAMPITLNLYQYDTLNPATPGALIMSKTQTFNIRFRPSSDAACAADPTRWMDSNGVCNNGIAQIITFKLASPDRVLPDRLVYGIAYNTSGFGDSPYGYGTQCAQDAVTGCAYDALNVGARAGAPKRGTDLFLDGTYVDATTGNNYCESVPVTGTFRLTDGCWTGFNPLVRFTVKK